MQNGNGEKMTDKNNTKHIRDFWSEVTEETERLIKFSKSKVEPANDEFMEEMKKESDRGCILVSAIHLDNILKEILETRLVKISSKEDDLLDLHRPIASFKARIDLAYRLGLISQKLHDDLVIVRDIRNTVAHGKIKIDFTNQSIRDKINNLTKSVGVVNIRASYRALYPPGTKWDFVMTVSFISWYLMSNLIDVTHIKPKSKETGIYGIPIIRS